jgi:endonuclease G
MKKVLISLFLLTSLHAQDFNYLPSSNNYEIIHHTYYTLSFLDKYKQAEWVAYKLTSQMIQGDTKRSNKFKEDPLVPTGSASSEDYKKSGYDRGHLCPAGDFKFSVEAMDETFYMSNMSPQKPGFNRGIWEKLEEQVRTWAEEYGVLYIAVGPILKRGLQTIGVYNKVAVPEQYYKIILFYNPPNIRAIAFLMNNESSNLALIHFVVSIDSVETLTHIHFFPALADSIRRIIEKRVDTSGWNFGNY